MKTNLNVAWLTLALAFAALCPAPAAAQEIVGGWEGETKRGYGFFSPVFSWKMTDRSFFVLRGSGSYLYYRTPEVGGDTEVRSPGAALGVALRFRTPRVSLTIGPGYETRWTRRELAGGQTVRVTEHGVTAQGDIFFRATPLTNLNLIASYGDANEYVWVRGGLKRQISNKDFSGPVSLIIGVEGTGQGNDELRVYQAGGLFELGLPRTRGSLQFRGGFSRERFPNGTMNSRPYVGVGCYFGF